MLEKYDVELIGASIEAIDRGENRESFKKIVEELGGEVARSVDLPHASTTASAPSTSSATRWWCARRFTMGGTGSGMAYDESDLRRIAGAGLAASPTTEVLLEESIIGWKEYELEVMRDKADNVVIVCSIENLDPMGVHTGDSITVAPAMTLTDREYQHLRDLSIGIIRSVGVDTGGCNIQFAVNPADGRVVVIEMNPRVSRSCALASKATGFPIAKIAAKVAIGYTLDEIPNDITAETPASFEPTLDYVVVKVPRFAFEKFPSADPTLTTHMKSVGEAMAIGRNFTEALQKALRSLENKAAPFDWSHARSTDDLDGAAATRSAPRTTAGSARSWTRSGPVRRPDQVFDATGIDPWFVDQLLLINEVALRDRRGRRARRRRLLRLAKRHGFSDAQVAGIRGLREDVVRGVRWALGIRPVYKTVDTCAAEFAARTPYHYSSYDEETEVAPREQPAVIILGSGPNRIGQGIEFDYSCVHASLALGRGRLRDRDGQLQPRDGLDRLRHQRPALLRAADARGRARDLPRRAEGGPDRRRHLPARRPDAARPRAGARGRRACPSSAPAPAAIHLAEERGAFGRVLAEAGLTAPKHGMATSYAEAQRIAAEIGYPVLVRPSYVLGGRGMEIVYDDDALRSYIEAATGDQPGPAGARRPVHRRRGRDRRRRDLRRRGPVPRRRDGAHRGGRHPLRRLGVRAAADHARRGGDRPDPRGHRGASRGASGCAGCSTSSTRSAPTCSTSSRPTRGRAAPCRSCPRRRRRRWPRPRPA